MKENRDTRISVDLLEHKQPYLDWCKAQNTSPSEAFRQIVAKLTSGKKSDPIQGAIEIDTPERPTKRKWIYLTQSEFKLVETIATAEGFSVAKWLVALVRNKITDTPQFGQAELESLTQSARQLSSIGKNLNQLVKVLNNTSRDPSEYRSTLSASIDEIKSAFKTHKIAVSNAVIANVRRWRI